MTRILKILIKLIFLNNVLLSTITFSQIAVGEQAVDVTLQNLQGDSVSLADFKDKIIVLNFFATWCIPCRTAMPNLENNVWQIFKDQGVQVLGVDLGEPDALVAGFVNDFGCDLSGTLR